jgi:hypothetical protein
MWRLGMVTAVLLFGTGNATASKVVIEYFGSVVQINAGGDLLGDSVHVGSPINGLISIDDDPSLWSHYE